MKKYLLIALWFCLGSVQAYGTSAWHAFVSGDYLKARELGRNENTAHGFTTACRASLVIGGFRTDDVTATQYLHTAIRDCLQALKIDNRHFDAQMSLAIALSFEGKRVKNIFYPKTAREILEHLLQEHPDNALAYGALGAWHSQVSAAGFFARITLKASRKNARKLFTEAFSHGVIDFPLRMEHLKFLAAGSKKERREALEVAKALVAETVYSEFDRLLQERANILLEALYTGKKRNIKKAIKNISAFSKAEGWEDIDDFPKTEVSEAALY